MNSIEVTELLTCSLKAYRDQNPEVRSFQFIQEKTGVSKSYLSRLEKGELKGPDPKKFIKLSELVADKKTNTLIYNFFLFDLLNCVDKGDADLKITKRQLKQSVTDNLDRLLSEPKTAIPYFLCATQNGASKEDVAKMGDYYVLGLEELIELEYIIKLEGRYHAQEKDYSYSAKTGLAQIGFLAQLLPLQDIDKREAQWHSVIKDVDFDTKKKLQRMAYNYMCNVLEVINNAPHGNYVWYSVSANANLMEIKNG